MIIYNVTTKVANEFAEEWLQWMREEHIPAVMDTACFTGTTILQLMETDDQEGLTYAVQYKAESKALYNRYIELFDDGLRKETLKKWGDRCIAFRTVMKIVQ